MSWILLATDEETLRRQLTAPLARSGLSVAHASSWPTLLQRIAAGRCAMALVDARLPGLSPELLHAVAGSLRPTPPIRSLRGPAPPLEEAPHHPDAVVRMVRRQTATLLPPRERRELRLLGLGPDWMERISEVAHRSRPTRIEGERGTGKARVARVVHRLSGRPGPLIELAEPLPPEAGGPPGTIYLRTLDRADPRALEALASACERLGWGLLGASREPFAPDLPGGSWARLRLVPLRERPEELRRLTLHYLDVHRHEMGLPRRRLDRALWSLIHAHRWPGNAQELETFVVRLLETASGSVIRADHVPPEVIALVASGGRASLDQGARAIGELVGERLADLLDTIEVDRNLHLHREIVRAVEGALVRVALARTAGNQKAAAALLGLARNTLRAKAADHGLLGSRT